MTGQKVMLQALGLLGYVDASGDLDSRQVTELTKRTVPVVNQVLADVRRITRGQWELIGSSEDTLPVSEDIAMRVLVPGICMYIAQGENDGEQQQLYAAMYEQARATLPVPADRVTDVIPRPCG